MPFGSCATTMPPCNDHAASVEGSAPIGCGGATGWGAHVCRDRVLLLNQCTDVINFWQEEERKTTIEDARSKYPSIVFQGA